MLNAVQVQPGLKIRTCRPFFRIKWLTSSDDEDAQNEEYEYEVRLAAISRRTCRIAFVSIEIWLQVLVPKVKSRPSFSANISFLRR